MQSFVGGGVLPGFRLWDLNRKCRDMCWSAFVDSQ